MESTEEKLKRRGKKQQREKVHGYFRKSLGSSKMISFGTGKNILFIILINDIKYSNFEEL